MKIGLIILVVLIIVALLVGSSFISRRNQMAIKREAVNAAWAQVDVVLQRRADLIPNLVETVKGFAQHEEEVFGEIAKARSAYLNATTPSDKIAANSQLEASLAKV
jgi:LemA protein